MNKKFYISIVSHGHEKLIFDNHYLLDINKQSDTMIIIKDNIASASLKQYCLESGFYYIDGEKLSGFGRNNNINFRYCIDMLGMKDDDFFLVINPDVVIKNNDFIKLKNALISSDPLLSSIILYLSDGFLDNSRREFPTLRYYLKKLFFKSRDSNNFLDRPDFIAGSFQCFKVSLYRMLGGFDEKYFMYCEDVDICWRAYKFFSVKPFIFKDIHCIHYAARNNRKIFSKHFFWHAKSIVRYLLLSKKI